MKIIDSLRTTFSKFGWKVQTLTVALVSIAIVTSVLDEMQVIWHIWLAMTAFVGIFLLYRTVIHPKCMTAFNFGDNTKSHFNIFLLSYLVSWSTGAGLFTAFLNCVSIISAASIIVPFVPSLFLPLLGIVSTITFLVLGIFGIIHYSVAFPLSLIILGASVYVLHGLSKISTYEIADIESKTNILQRSKFSAADVLKSIGFLMAFGVTLLVIIYWICLSMNPFWMEAKEVSKYETLHRLPHDANLRVREVRKIDDLRFYKNAGALFPVVIKPSICTTSSRNVKVCPNYKCLENYLNHQIKSGPRKDGLNGDKMAWVVQEYSNQQEAVVFYYKIPYMKHGAIKNVGIRDPAEFTGNLDRSTDLEARYWPGKYLYDASPQFIQFFDDLASKIPGYYGGRFDIMMPTDQVQSARDVHILEMNVFMLGSIDEKGIKSFSGEIRRIRTSLMQFYVGIVNIVAGYNFLSFWGIALKVPGLINRNIMCDNFEHVMAKP